MRRRSAIAVVSWFIALVHMGVGPARAGEGESIRLTFVATADFHGALEARHAKVVGGREVGGIDVIASYMQALRKRNPNGVVLLDAGDLYQGTLLSAASEGRAVIDFYNHLGYSAATIGNHDFDFGPTGYHSVPDSPDEDPLGVIKERVAEAKFPFVVANIFDRRTKKPVAWKNLSPYTLVRRKGIVVGVVGVTTVDTPLVTHPANVRGLEFRPLLPTLRRILPEMRKAGATVIVVLAHAGVEVDERTGDFIGPVSQLVRQLEPGEVDLIISGHTHVPFSGKIGQVPVVQSWPNGIGFAFVDLFVDPETKRVKTDKSITHDSTFYFRAERDGSEVRFLGEPIRSVPSFEKKLKVFRRSVAHLQRIRLGRVLRDLAYQTDLDSPVGNLVTDAMKASDKEIEIAMYNSRGLRTSIPKGVVTFGRIYEVVPFDNSLVKVTLSGGQIREILEHGLSGSYGVMEISGLKVEVDAAAGPGKKCISITTDDGAMLDDGRMYVVGTNEFVLNGGDGYFTFTHGRDVEYTHTLIRELVARYIKEKGTVDPDMGGRYSPAMSSVERKDL